MDYDLIIRGGTIVDGTGGEPYRGDVAISGDKIVAVGDIGNAEAHEVIDVNGLAIAPGFINMLSWSVESLIEDGRSQSEIRQGALVPCDSPWFVIDRTIHEFEFRFETVKIEIL